MRLVKREGGGSVLCADGGVEGLERAQTDGKAARSLAKLQLFRQFYVMVVIYIYFTRIVVFLLRSTMPYHYMWLSDVADLAATLAFYVFTGSKFRPIAGNPYLELDDDDYVERELVLQEELDKGLP
jgi:G protein-coupled receptor 107